MDSSEKADADGGAAKACTMGAGVDEGNHRSTKNGAYYAAYVDGGHQGDSSEASRTDQSLTGDTKVDIIVHHW